MEQLMVSANAVVRRSLAEFREERTEGALLRPGDRVAVGLDGEVTFIDALGDDQRIVDAARVSYQRGTSAHRSTAGLIDFLIRHKHTSPLEQVEIVLRVRCPMFIARQLMRHRTSSVNEVSARYSELPEEYWLPPVGDLRMQGDQANKQMSGQAYPEQVGALLQKMMETANQAAFNVYRKLLDVGLSREQARSVLPASTYTEFYWKQDLHNYLHLCNLRADAHAQPEVQAYAEVLIEIARSVAPLAVGSWENHIRNAVTLSEDELGWLSILLTRFATSDTYPPELAEQLGKSRAEELWKKVYRIQKNGAKL